ncbi:uncharacterized protein IL334_002482 [Kwoniella shivajii]|uniref:Uncharacterized protein n=1 Tax=Kwoniella shivajii TaxID=564305 RepID=A0ABZ1CW18_9TREE|nr:hypothetical protein IL334_002482 [Kwoniella shivajii]
MVIHTEGKYVPPALRARQIMAQLQSSGSDTTARSNENQFSHHELNKIFETTKLSSLNFFCIAEDDTKIYSTKSAEYEDDDDNILTVHPLENLINFIIVYDKAHPYWEEKKEMWLHNNCEKLIEDYNDMKKNFGRPIPVFEGQGRMGNFNFTGWWNMDIKNIKDTTKAYPRAISDKGRKEALSATWVKLAFTPATGRFKSLKRFGKGEASEYALESSGLDEELETLRSIRDFQEEDY